MAVSTFKRGLCLPTRKEATEGSINSEKFKEFTERLVGGKRRKVFLILDNATTHHSKLLTGFGGGKQEADIVILFTASPDLNPDEHTNAE